MLFTGMALAAARTLLKISEIDGVDELLKEIQAFPNSGGGSGGR